MEMDSVREWESQFKGKILKHMYIAKQVIILRLNFYNNFLNQNRKIYVFWLI